MNQKSMRIKINIFSASILVLAMFLSTVAFALVMPDEGMFTPDQISELQLRKKGLKIKPIDIYNPNGVSLSDAIMRVNIGSGGFGTGEFVSPNGLILTNHHVGFDALVAASSTAKDYAKNGYKADSVKDELPAKDYTLLLTQKVENVTDKIRRGTANLTGAAFSETIEKNIKDLEIGEQAKAAKNSTIRVQELNDGYFYYLYETTMIKDVRVVYAPPQDIGFFGGDPDNFEWTRHTGDFTFLRAYVAPDGTPAEYSANNVPFKPKKFLTISLDGVDENEFVMVLGYPGGTTRYRESQSVDYAQNVNFPFLADYLQARSDALTKVGETNPDKKISLQDTIFGLNNSVKVFSGGQRAIIRGDVLAKKRAEESRFAAWVAADPARQAKYKDVLPKLRQMSDDYYKNAGRDRVLGIFPSSTSTPVFRQIYDAVVALKQGKKLGNDEAGMKTRADIKAVFADSEPFAEQELVKFFLRKVDELPAAQKFEAYQNYFGKLNPQERRQAEADLAQSIFKDDDFNSPEAVIKLYDRSFEDVRNDDPKIVDFIIGLANERAQIGARNEKFNAEINPVRLLYQQGLAEMNKTTPYPDANASLRFTYGEVKGYSPREAVIYTPFTTLNGVIDKDTGVAPFDVPEKLKQLQNAKDFGRYGVGNSVFVNFLATTDIIGGNSGSPVLNGYGEQVGIVFDGNYEGLGNDIFYNPNYGRTIAVDIRYVLFVTEKFGNAGWILNEMTIKEANKKAKTANAE